MGKETIPAKARRTAEIPHFCAAIDTELIKNVTDDGLFQNPLLGAAEEHGFRNKENGHGSDAVATNFGHGGGHFRNGGFQDRFHLFPHPETSSLPRTRFRVKPKCRKARYISILTDSLWDVRDLCWHGPNYPDQERLVLEREDPECRPKLD